MARIATVNASAPISAPLLKNQQTHWTPDVEIREEIHLVDVDDVLKIRLGGEELFGDSDLFVDVTDKAVIATFLKALRNAEVASDHPKRTWNEDFPPLQEHQFMRTYAFLEIYLEKGHPALKPPTVGRNALLYVFRPAYLPYSPGPQFHKALKAFSTYHAETIKRQIQANRKKIVSISFERHDGGAYYPAIAPITEPARIKRLLNALNEADERVLVTHTYTFEDNFICPILELNLPKKEIVPVYMVLPPRKNNPPAWLQELYEILDE